MQFKDKFGWPVEVTHGRPIQNFIRLLIHTNIKQTLKDSFL